MVGYKTYTRANVQLGGKAMKAYVINMSVAVERMAFQEAQLSDLGIEYERVNAVTTKDLSDETYNSCACDWERPMSQAEVACFFSHYNLWERIAQSKQPALILEDDAVLAPDLGAVLAALKSHSDLNYASLETRKRKKLLGNRSVKLVSGYSMQAMYQDRCGAAAYVLWPAGAAILLSEYKKLGAAITDAFISRSYALNAQQVVPAPAIQADCCDHYNMHSPIILKSSIENTRYSVDSAPASTSMFKLKRIVGQLRMGWRQLMHIYNSKRIEITPSETMRKKYAE